MEFQGFIMPDGIGEGGDPVAQVDDAGLFTDTYIKGQMPVPEDKIIKGFGLYGFAGKGDLPFTFIAPVRFCNYSLGIAA